MSEVLGDAEPSGEWDDAESGEVDDDEYDDGLDGEPGVVREVVRSVFTPASLAIAALVIATANLLLPLSGYVITTALTLSHSGQELYAPRALAVLQLVVAVVTAWLAATALWSAAALPDEERRTPQILAGSAVLISVFATVQAVVGLIVLANTHLPIGG